MTFKIKKREREKKKTISNAINNFNPSLLVLSKF